MARSLGPPRSVDLGVGVDLSRYGFKSTPFPSSTDPAVLWRGPAQRELLARLEAGVIGNAGVLLLFGDVGTGKSILAKALLEDLRSGAFTAAVLYPELDPLDFLRVIGRAWGLSGRLAGREEFYDRLQPFLEVAASQDTRVLLLVDELQSLSRELLDEVRTLATIHEVAGTACAPVNILLVGQEGANAVLARPENATLRRTIAVTGFTQPLGAAEVSAYINHHLTLAGAERVTFTAEAIQEIAKAAQGTPRVINTICDIALLTGARRNADSIDAEIVAEAVTRLGLSSRRPVLVERPASRRVRSKTMIAAAAGVLVSVAIAGYLVAFRGGPVRAEHGPDMSTAAVAPGVPAPVARDSGEPEPAPRVESPSPERRAEPPARPLVAQPARAPELPAALPGRPLPESRIALPPTPAVEPLPPPRIAMPLPRPAPRTDGVSREPERTEPSRPAAPTVAGDDASTARTVAGRESAERRSREDDDDTDPSAIIDWVLRRHPARRE